MPRVSVYMPCYNHARFVKATIASVQNQTYQDFEIVVTDDGSDDESAVIVAAINEPRLKLRRLSKNSGLGVAMNDAIRRSSGDYLCQLNADDLFLPSKLATQVAFLDANPQIGAVFGHLQVINEEGVRQINHPTRQMFMVENRSQAAWLRQFFFYGNCVAHPTAMIRRECFDKVGFYDERLFQIQDLELWMRLTSVYPIHIIPQDLTEWRVLPNAGNVSAWTPERDIRFNWELVQALRFYASLPLQQFVEVFREEIEQLGCDVADQSLALGRICLTKDNPALHRLGLGLLFDAVPAQSTLGKARAEFGPMDLIREAAKWDVFNLGAQRQVEHLRRQLQAAEQRLQDPLRYYDEVGRQRGYLTTWPARPEQTIDFSLPNLALNKPATQSSVSPWSRGGTPEDDARNAVNGDPTKEYGFHTSDDPSPWWMVDLGGPVRIQFVRIFNREAVEWIQRRASPLIIEVSETGDHWTLIFQTSPGHLFTGHLGGRPLIFSVNHPSAVRFLRITIPRREWLHLAEVEIYGKFLPQQADTDVAATTVSNLERQLRAWSQGVASEIQFWSDWVASKGLQWPDDYAARMNPQAPIKPAIGDLIGRTGKSIVSILDVGAGPVTNIGYIASGKEIHITGVDPLAEAYASILRRHGISIPVRTTFAVAEDLSLFLGPAKFDIVVCRNALDHSFDPVRGIIEMLKVVAVGGFVHLTHYVNEAVMENYGGLHQNNFCAKEGRFIIWNKDAEVDVEEAIPIAVEIESREVGETRSWMEKKQIIVTIRKLGEFTPEVTVSDHGSRLATVLQFLMEIIGNRHVA